VNGNAERNIQRPNERCEISVAEQSRETEENHTGPSGEATVPDERAQESVNREIHGDETLDAKIVRRRQNNRAHMRRRRADPANCAREQEKRKSMQSAARRADASSSPSVAQPMGRVCAICHLRAAVEEITRLEPSTFTREATHKYGCLTAGAVDGCF
jgi:hypothetical protein